jgi:arabinose-5-phosphate isomerase
MRTLLLYFKKVASPEIKVLVPLLKRFEITLIAITGNTASFLAKGSQF